MLTNTKTMLIVFGMLVVAGCSSVTSPEPEIDTEEMIEYKCSVVLSSHLPDEQRWPIYRELLQDYVNSTVDNQAEFDRANAFLQAVKMDESEQLFTELIEVTDWGCANGNYFEEIGLFIREVQK